MNSTGIRVKGIMPYLFLLPMLIGVGIFGFGCFIYVLGLSFTKTNLLISQFVGLDNYYYVLFKKPWFSTALLHTVYYAVWTIPLKLSVALGLALLLYRKMRFGSFFRFAYLMPWVSSAVIIALVFKYIFNSQFGIVNWFLGQFGFDKVLWTKNFLVAVPVIALMESWQHMGFGMLLFLGALNTIPREIEEASSLEGASNLKRFYYITLPLLKPTIFFYLVVSLIGAFSVFDTVYGFLEGDPGGAQASQIFNSPVLVCSYLVYLMGFRMFAFGRAAAIAIMMFILVLSAILVQHRLLGKEAT